MNFSIIIPTYGRSSAVIIETLTSLLNLGAELPTYCQDIYLMDQNWPRLDLSILQDRFDYHLLVDNFPRELPPQLPAFKVKLHHFFSLKPSVTYAKNTALKYVQTPLILFLDDDVSVQAGCLQAHHQHHQQLPKMGMLGGREVIVPLTQGRASWREHLVRLVEMMFAQNSDAEDEYKLNGRYVGRVLPNSLFFAILVTSVQN